MNYFIKFYTYDGKAEKVVGTLSYDGHFRYTGVGETVFSVYRNTVSSPEELRGAILSRLRSPYLLAVEQ